MPTTQKDKKEQDVKEIKRECKRESEKSLVFHTKKGEGKRDILSKQDALIQICFLLQQIPCETLTLICGEAGTNADSTVSKQKKKKCFHPYSVHECKFILLLSHLMTNAHCHCH